MHVLDENGVSLVRATDSVVCFRVGVASADFAAFKSMVQAMAMTFEGSMTVQYLSDSLVEAVFVANPLYDDDDCVIGPEYPLSGGGIDSLESMLETCAYLASFGFRGPEDETE